VSFAYRPLYVASVDRAIFHEKTLSLLKISTTAGLINLVLNLCTIPFFGVWAAAINTLISFCYMGMAGHFMKTTRQFLGLNYYVGYALLLILITAAGTYLLRDADPWIKICVTTGELLFSYQLYRWKGKAMIREINSLRSK
jgi:O-antigen/teichoic acid export membrane protein